MLQKEVLIKEKRMHADVGEHIGYELGAKMIMDYANKYNETGSHFIGRNIIEQILSQPGCVGIKVFNALNENQEKTLVIVGINNDGAEMLSVTAVTPDGEMKTQEGIVADKNIIEGWIDKIWNL